MSQNQLSESFEWAVLPSNVPKDQVLKIVAKTPATTIHPEDPKYPKRIFPVKELELAARTLIGKSLYYEHMQPIKDSLIFRSEWNPLTLQVESLAIAPPEFIKKVREGKIKKASAKYGWAEERQEDGGTAFIGLFFKELSLLEILPPGDPGASVSLAEGQDPLKEGLMEAAVIQVQDPTERIKQLETYVSELEAKLKATEGPLAEWGAWCQKEKERKEAEAKVAAETAKKIKTLEESITRQTNTIKTLENSRAEAIAVEVEKYKMGLLSRVEAVIPKTVIIRQGSFGLRRLIVDLQKLVRDERGS